jgi:hypothetical protein
LNINASQIKTQVDLPPAVIIHSFDINANRPTKSHEMITAISVFQGTSAAQDPLLAVSTIQNNHNGDNEGKLKAIHIFKLNQTTNKIEPMCYHDFG